MLMAAVEVKASAPSLPDVDAVALCQLVADAYIADEKVFNDNSEPGPTSPNVMRIRAVAELLGQCQESAEPGIRTDFVTCLLDVVVRSLVQGHGPEAVALWRGVSRGWTPRSRRTCGRVSATCCLSSTS